MNTKIRINVISMSQNSEVLSNASFKEILEEARLKNSTVFVAAVRDAAFLQNGK